MTNNKVNLFISSKNRLYTEENNKISLSIPDGLLTVREDEYFILKIMSFYCNNTMYNINSTNNWIKINNVNYYLPVGNPNINDIRDSLNTQFIGINLVVSYDKITNKLVFSNNSVSSKSLIVLTAGLFLGLDNNTTYNINAGSYTTSVNPINVIDNNAIIISVNGDIELSNNNLDYSRNNTIQTNNIIFKKTIDVPKNCVIQYENKGDDIYSYPLSNIDSINYFTINIFNQDLKYLEDMTDYHLCLQFEKLKKDNSLTILNKIREILNDILLILFNFATKYGVM